MATDSLQIFGTSYPGVTGIKATDTNNIVQTYIRPQGTLSVTANGTGIDVTEYAAINVNVSGDGVSWETVKASGSHNIATEDGTHYYILINNYTTPITSNETYRVTWNGTQYICQTKVTDISLVYDGYTFGNQYIEDNTQSDTEEPFLFYRSNSTTLIGLTTQTSGSITCMIERQTSNNTPTLQAKTNINPTTTSQTIMADSGYDGLSSVQINGDANLIAANIKSDVSIFGVTGTYTGGGGTRTTVVPEQTINASDRYNQINFLAPLVVGETYIYTIDGVESETLAFDNYGSVAIGQPETTMGFEYANSTMFFTVADSTLRTQHTIKVEQESSGGSSTLIEKTITTNGTYNPTNDNADGYSLVTVNVSGGTYQAKSNINPTTSSQTITPDSGYDALSSVQINAMPTLTLPTSISSSATSGYTNKATISRSTSDQYINIGTGYNAAGGYYKIEAVANGSATGPSSLSGSSATVSTGTNTLTLTKTGVTTTPTVSAGYVSAATASTATVTLTASVTTKAAATITPTITNQTIASGTYLTGTQTISGDANLVAENIKSGTTIFGVTGSYTDSGGSNKNIQYFMGRDEVSATSYTTTSLSITVSKAGSYKCYWVMDRNTTSGTSGSRLYKNDTAVGTAHTSWTYNNNNRNGMNCEETLTLAANDVLVVRARSRSTSYICGVSNFIIVEQ